MKQPVLLIALGLGAAGAFAQEVGQVISSVPVVQQVQVPRQVCQPGMAAVDPYYPQQTSGAGGLIGAIAGAALGSTIGHGNGRGAAMAIGAIGGALAGNQIESNGRVQHAQAQGAVTQCTTQVGYENRTVGYNVTYEYAGRQHTVQMPYDPGPTIRLQVSPVGVSDQPQQFMPHAGQPPHPVVIAPSVHSGVTYVQPPVVVPYPAYPVAYPAYPAYRPYYPPVGLSLNFGYGYSRGGHHHHNRRHSHR
jgi:uncharacterized protein YcfJ